MLRKENTAPSIPKIADEKVNPICNRYIGPTIVSFTGKSLGVGGAILSTFPFSPELAVAAATSGIVSGLSSGVLRYHMTTKTNLSPGINLATEGTTSNKTDNTDEAKAMVISVASSSDALLEGYKTSLKTSHANSTISWVFVITTAYNQLVSGMQASGQKWFGETGKNFSDTWVGCISDKLTTLDCSWITKNVIDIKSLITTLKPSVEITSQYISMLDFVKLVGAPSASLAALAGTHAFAIAGTHTQNYAPRGYEQQIMQQNLKPENAEKSYTAWCFDKVGKVVDSAITIGSVPFDLVSIIIPPKYVLYGSHILGSTASGYSIYSQALTKIPLAFLQNPYVTIPIITLGTATYAYSEITSLMAAWKQPVTIEKCDTKSDEKTALSQSAKKEIGVLPLLNEKFGVADEKDSYLTGVKKRFVNYKNYAQKNMGYYCSSIYDCGSSATSKVTGYVGSFFSSSKKAAVIPNEAKSLPDKPEMTLSTQIPFNCNFNCNQNYFTINGPKPVSASNDLSTGEVKGIIVTSTVNPTVALSTCPAMP